MLWHVSALTVGVEFCISNNIVLKIWTLETVLLIFWAWRHVTFCRDWVKSRSRGVRLSFFTRTVDARSRLHVPAGVPLGKHAIEYISGAFRWSHSRLLDYSRSQTATLAGNGCYRKTCSRGSAKISFCPLQLQFLLWQQSWFHSEAWGTVSVLPLQLVLCTEPELCCWLLVCVFEVQLSSWHRSGQSFEHAIRQCTIPLFLHSINEWCNVKYTGCIYSGKNNMHTFLNNLFHLNYLRHISNK